MSVKHKFSKPVAFNTYNETDNALLQFVSRKNFSGYVKKLIIEDMKRKGVDVPKYKKTRRTTSTSPGNTPQLSRLERLRQQLELASDNIHNNANSNPQTESDN